MTRDGWAVTALVTFAAVDVVDTVLAVGNYEERITVVTHGSTELWPAALVHALFAHLVTDVHTARPVMWTLALLFVLVAAPAAVLPRLGGWLAAAVLLKVVSVTHQAFAAPPAPVIEGVLNSRPVAYPLWTLSTVVVVVTAVRAVRVIQRTTATRTAGASGSLR